MLIREYKDSDLDDIKRMHKASGFGYGLPPMDECFSKRVVEDESGIGMVSMLRHCAEAYLICDPKWRNGAWRFEALRQLQAVANDDARQVGVVEALAAIPPVVEQRFRRRLINTGWVRCRTKWIWYAKKVV